MQFILNRFNEKYQKENKINIRFFDENPLSIRRIRYNQSGAVCYCMSDKEKGKQKVSNIWKNVNCSEDCKYRLSTDEISKPQCNLEGTLKFLLPDISTDRIFIMKITGQTSIKRLQSYFDLQKQLGNSLIGDYILFLKQEEQINKQGKVFNNYILDIIQKEDFISDTTIIQNSKNSIGLTQVPQTNTKKVDISKVNTEKVDSKITSIDVIEKTESKDKSENTKASVKNKSNKNESDNSNKNLSEENSTPKNFENYYFLIETYSKEFMKDGKPTNYLIGSFVDMQDKTIDVVIPPQFADELLKCDTGTNVILSLEKKGDKTFTKIIEYVQKIEKNVAA